MDGDDVSVSVSAVPVASPVPENDQVDEAVLEAQLWREHNPRQSVDTYLQNNRTGIIIDGRSRAASAAQMHTGTPRHGSRAPSRRDIEDAKEMEVPPG